MAGAVGVCAPAALPKPEVDSADVAKTPAEKEAPAAAKPLQGARGLPAAAGGSTPAAILAPTSNVSASAKTGMVRVPPW